MKFDTANMCLHLQKKLFDEDGAYHHLMQAIEDDPEITAVVRSRQLHIYRNGKRFETYRKLVQQNIESACLAQEVLHMPHRLFITRKTTLSEPDAPIVAYNTISNSKLH
jgi:hypothetical protein